MPKHLTRKKRAKPSKDKEAFTGHQDISSTPPDGEDDDNEYCTSFFVDSVFATIIIYTKCSGDFADSAGANVLNTSVRSTDALGTRY